MKPAEKQRLEKYSARVLIWRPISIGIAYGFQVLFYMMIFPHINHDPWQLALYNTLFINLWLIPIGIAWEYWWSWMKHKIFPKYAPGMEPGHEHRYVLDTSMKCRCGRPITEAPFFRDVPEYAEVNENG